MNRLIAAALLVAVTAFPQWDAQSRELGDLRYWTGVTTTRVSVDDEIYVTRDVCIDRGTWIIRTCLSIGTDAGDNTESVMVSLIFEAEGDYDDDAFSLERWPDVSIDGVKIGPPPRGPKPSDNYGDEIGNFVMPWQITEWPSWDRRMEHPVLRQFFAGDRLKARLFFADGREVSLDIPLEEFKLILDVIIPHAMKQ